MNFDCPFCAQNLDAESEMAGMLIACPACKRLLSVPDRAPERPAGDTTKSSTVRINLPPGLDLPKESQPVIKLRRPHA